MSVAILPSSLLVVAGSGWRKAFSFFTGRGFLRAGVDISAYRAVAVLAPVNAPATPALLLSSDNGLIRLSTNQAVLTVSAAALIAWADPQAPFDCDFRLRIIDPADEIDRFVVQSDPYASRVRVLP